MTVAYVAVACRVLTSVVFAVAVIGKLRGPAAWRGFVASLAGTRLLPASLTTPIAVAVVSAEAVVAALSAATQPLLARWGLAAGAGLAGVFTVFSVAVTLRGERVPCRCFGSEGRPLDRWSAARSLAVAGAALLAAVAWPPNRTQPGGIAVAMAAGLVVALLVISSDQLRWLLSPPRTISRPRHRDEGLQQ